MTDRLCILTVHAHPDDESSKGAGTIAKYAAAGAHTVLAPALRDVYRHAIASVFGAGTAIVLVALLLMWFLPDVQMNTTSSTTPPKS